MMTLRAARKAGPPGVALTAALPPIADLTALLVVPYYIPYVNTI